MALEANAWARQQFGECELGDKRRTERAVKYAAAAVDHPDGSTPEQTEDTADGKGVYRRFDCAEVTFRALAEPHRRATRARAEGLCLILGDTMETDFGNHRKATGLGPTGHGSGYGFFMHSGLLVQADTGEIVGMAGQEIFYRQPRAKSENSYQRTQRRRESEVWGRLIDEIGPPPAARRSTKSRRCSANANAASRSTGPARRAAANGKNKTKPEHPGCRLRRDSAQDTMRARA